MAPRIGGHGVLGPLPVLERRRVELELARGRGEAGAELAVDENADARPALRGHARHRVHRRAFALGLRQGRLVRAIDVVGDQERAVLAHVRERRQPLLPGDFGQTGHAVLEDPPVELLDPQLLAGPVRRLEVLADAEGPVGIDAPRELDPELVFLPHLPQPRRLVRLPGRVEDLALTLEGHAQHGLAESDPARRVRLLAHEVVPLRGVAHGQHVVGEPRRLAPDRSEAGVALDLGFVRQHLDPRHPVGIGPHGVVDASEVHGELAPAFLEEVRQEKAHLEERQRVLARHEELAPHLGGRRHHGWGGHGLVPGARGGAARRGDGAHEDDHQLESARDLPAEEVARRGIAPDVAREGASAPADLARHLLDAGGGHPGLRLRELRRVGRVDPLERSLELLELHGRAGALPDQVFLPVDPAAHELPVPGAVAEQDVHEGQEQGGSVPGHGESQ